MNTQDYTDKINKASTVVGKTFPLYAFVTSNPLSGYEGMSFEDATQEAEKMIGTSALPQAKQFREAWKNGKINKDILEDLLIKAGLFQQPEFYLMEMEKHHYANTVNSTHELDRILTKWLGVFLDEGMAEWEMPGRSQGFYKAWRKLALHDQEITVKSIDEIPETAPEALSSILNGLSEDEQFDVFKYNIASLPGWTGYIKYRMDENSAWQKEFPITMQDYLAVRLWIAKNLYGEIKPEHVLISSKPMLSQLQHIWLSAWEETFQDYLITQLKNGSAKTNTVFNGESDLSVQFVFCIDTRSEMIRRHLEQQKKYETFGYAGFFGLATDYRDLTTGIVRKSCPPIVNSTYIISETAQVGNAKPLAEYIQKANFTKFLNFLSKRMKNMLPSAFGYVEGGGTFYGFAILWRSLFSANYYERNGFSDKSHESICEPQIHYNSAFDTQISGISTEEKVQIVKSAFELLGWENFAPLVVFTGHASHSVNNPFGSSLDCGACAASPGRHNARLLAKLANLPEVRLSLKENFNINIPSNTFFVGAEHNTTTENIVLFDNTAPDSHLKAIELLKLNLIDIQQATISERLGLKKDSLKEVHRKASDWAETRPEWGLAGNAGFIIAPRRITKGIDLENRCFLHSYDWRLDATGQFLETIMQGPMVVTQWINNHYYFSTVDNEKFGSGSKITHNVMGKFGVVQGNGGDLKIGLPFQSIGLSDEKMFHEPLKLTVIIQAPLRRVSEILMRNSHLKSLLDNNWIYLAVMDPLTNNQIFRYQKDGGWCVVGDEKIIGKEVVDSKNFS